MREFMGYMRPDGKVGIRNQVLILPGGFEEQKVCEAVAGAVQLTSADLGIARTAKDTETIARVREGLGRNPNVYGVVVMGVSGRGDGDMGGSRLSSALLADAIEETGKPVARIGVNGPGRGWEGIAQACREASRLVWEASRVRRERVPLGKLHLGVKCGGSDPFSGLAGNPAVGYLFDRVVEAGGTAIFGETTEVIGAEHVVARRCVSEKVARELLDAVDRQERLARESGQDIRTINPVPSNIAAGISTIEEKSLGAIHKSGHAPIQGVLQYGEVPGGNGLYFMDSYVANSSIFLGHAAAGASLVIYQLGGGGRSEGLLTGSHGVVAPLMWTTGNPRTAEGMKHAIDFSAATVITGEETAEEVGERLLDVVIDIASGTLTRGEMLRYLHPLQMYLQDPTF